jgi:uncharacterized cupin superfamily protein
MPEPSLAFANIAVELKSAPIRREWILDGEPVARNQVLALSEDRMATTLVWDCTAGRFRWLYDTDETIHILEGEVRLTGADGVTKRLGAGDVVFFPAGSSATWQIDRYVRKLAFFRQPVPRPMSLFLRAFRKAAGLADRATGAGMPPVMVEERLTPIHATQASFAFENEKAA